MKRSLLLLSLAFGTMYGQVITEYHSLVKQAKPRSFQHTADPSAAVVGLTDTLQYFYNKHTFRNIWNGTTTSPNLLFGAVLQPNPTGGTSVSHWGSVFLNNTPIQVVGLEGAVALEASAPSMSVPVRLYLCNLNGANMPIFPALDSVTGMCSSTTGFEFIGGNFNAPVNVTGNFAVLIRNVSTNPLDSVRLIMNNASAPTSTAPAHERYGENLGRLRFNGNFQSMTNVFGTGNDREFIVAPRIVTGYTAGITVPVQSQTVCTNALALFGNASAPVGIIENRQFNFNQFYKHFSPWSLTTNSLITNVLPDSVYQWDFPNANIPQSFQKNTFTSFNLAGVHTASLEARYRQSANLGNNISIVDLATHTVMVTAGAAPVISVSGNLSICSGGSTTLTASGNTTFTWTNPATTSPSINVSPLFTTSYTVAGENNGCIGVQIVQVQVSQPPTLNLTAPVAVCQGKSFTMTATGANSYTWTHNGSNTSSVIVTPNASGAFDYTVRAENAGCPVVQGVANVNVHPLPSVSIFAETFTLCSQATGGEPYQFTGEPFGGVFQVINAGPGQITSTGLFTPKAVGALPAIYNYTDEVTGCTNSHSVSVKIVACDVSGINEKDPNANLQVYPNPAINGLLHMRNLEGQNTIQVYNMLGVLVSSTVVDKAGTQIDLSALPRSQYLIKVISSESGTTRVFRVISE